MGTQTSPTYWAITAAVTVAALGLGAGGMWLIQASTVRDLEQRIAFYESADSFTGSSATTDSSSPVTEETTADGTNDTEPDNITVAETTPTYVTNVHVTNSVTYVTLDYIQFLTGDEAASAAAAHGDESPPPNDYYILNENPKLREYPVEDGITVEIVFSPEGYSIPEGQAIPLDDWIDGITGTMSAYYMANYYIVTVTDGTITALDQQYLP